MQNCFSCCMLRVSGNTGANTGQNDCLISQYTTLPNCWRCSSSKNASLSIRHQATQRACRKVSNSLRNTPTSVTRSTHNHMHTTSQASAASLVHHPQSGPRTTSCGEGVGPMLPAQQQTHGVIPVRTYPHTSTSQKSKPHALLCCRHETASWVHVNMDCV